MHGSGAKLQHNLIKKSPLWLKIIKYLLEIIKSYKKENELNELNELQIRIVI